MKPYRDTELAIIEWGLIVNLSLAIVGMSYLIFRMLKT